MLHSSTAAAAAATAAATAGFTVGAADDVEDDEDDEEQGDDWSFLGRRRETGVELNVGVHAAAASSTAAVRAESHVFEILFDLALVSIEGVLLDNLSDPCLETAVAPSVDLATFVLSESDDSFDRSSISNVQETDAPFSTMNFIIDDE